MTDSQDGASYRPPPLLAGSLALHAAGALALAVAPRHWRAIAGVLVADHVVLAAASLWPRSQVGKFCSVGKTRAGNYSVL